MTLVLDKMEPAVSTHKVGNKLFEYLTPCFRLSWVDHSLHDAPAGTAIQPFLRQRDFKHLGGAIAWGRRRIFHGEVFGDAIELVQVERRRVDGAYDEDLNDAQEITLAGFQPWTRKSNLSSGTEVVLEPVPKKRCTFE